MSEGESFAYGYAEGEREAVADISLSLCPYQYGLGTCTQGCHSEPSCITDGPGTYVESIAELLDRARRGPLTPGQHDDAARAAHQIITEPGEPT